MTKSNSPRLRLIACCLLLLAACTPRPNADVEDMSLEIAFFRTDSLMLACAEALQSADSSSFFAAYQQHLQPERDFWYQFMGLDQVPGVSRLSEAELDSLMAQELGRSLREPAMLHLLDTIRQTFPYTYDFQAEILPPLKRMMREFEGIELPSFHTHVSGYAPGGDMRTVDNIVPMPGYFSFGLHYFMGPDFPYYSPNIAAFQRKRLDIRFLAPLMMREISEGMVAPLNRDAQPQLLDGIIRAGIKQYFVQQMLPYTADSLCLLYSPAQMEWATFYEARIYKELMPHLFESDFSLQRDYLSDKPFTSQLAGESAPRIGEFMGWKVVESYMERHSEESLAELVERSDYEAIFRESRYKP